MCVLGHTVEHLVEALCCKPEYRGFYSQLRYYIFHFPLGEGPSVSIAYNLSTLSTICEPTREVWNPRRLTMLTTL
jgi:hypothetical protein